MQAFDEFSESNAAVAVWDDSNQPCADFNDLLRRAYAVEFTILDGQSGDVLYAASEQPACDLALRRVVPRGVATRPARTDRRGRPLRGRGDTAFWRQRKSLCGRGDFPHSPHRAPGRPRLLDRSAGHVGRGDARLGAPANGVDPRRPASRRRPGDGRSRDATHDSQTAARGRQPVDQPGFDLRGNQPAVSADAEPEALEERRGLGPHGAWSG